MKKIIVILLAFLFIANQSWATIATFQNGVSGGACRGAYIDSTQTNAEATDIIYLRFSYYDFLYFDVSTIPSAAIISSAVVTLNLTDSFSNDTINVGRLNNPDSGSIWSDFGSDSGGFVFSGAYATYNFKQYNNSTKWFSGGGSNNFTDVKHASETTFSISNGVVGTKTFDITAMTQAWVSNSTANWGLWMQDSGGNARATGIYNATTGNRPLLTVTYTIPGSTTATLIFGGTVNAGGTVKF